MRRWPSLSAGYTRTSRWQPSRKWSERFHREVVVTVKLNERTALTSFGRAQRFDDQRVENPRMTEEERARYRFPRLQVVGPGGPYFKWPWQKVYKVDVATQALDLTWDPTKRQDTIEAVTKDNLTTGVNGQVRFRVAEGNLYPFVFGVADPLQHVIGYFISVLRERIANFADPKGQALLTLAPSEAQTAAAPAFEAQGDGAEPDLSEGLSINDLRKNLPLLNTFMEQQCATMSSRYGIELEAVLITQINPSLEVDRALSAINSTRNQVAAEALIIIPPTLFSPGVADPLQNMVLRQKTPMDRPALGGFVIKAAADISTTRANVEQQITMSKRAVDIATNTAQAEVAPLKELAQTLVRNKEEGDSTALAAYVRNMRIPRCSSVPGASCRPLATRPTAGPEGDPPCPSRLIQPYQSTELCCE